MEKFIKRLLKKKSFVGTTNLSARLAWLEATLLKIPAGQKILDAGAGELDQKRFCNHLEYVSQDFGQYDGTGDNKGLQTSSWDNTKLDIVSDITAIPVPDQSFDAIMCIEVFEHIPDPISAIKEFSRIVKPGGHVIITAPFCSFTHFAPYHFYTGFNTYFYEKHLADNGFEVIEISANGNFFEYVAQELQRIPFCAEKYANHKVSVLDKAVIMKTLSLLGKLSRKNKGSEEFANFGLHVFARKK
jgi:ubiquinone/menaquinone biosynthesis C-methylase UbiE